VQCSRVSAVACSCREDPRLLGADLGDWLGENPWIWPGRSVSGSASRCVRDPRKGAAWWHWQRWRFQRSLLRPSWVQPPSTYRSEVVSPRPNRTLTAAEFVCQRRPLEAISLNSGVAEYMKIRPILGIIQSGPCHHRPVGFRAQHQWDSCWSRRHRGARAEFLIVTAIMDLIRPPEILGEAFYELACLAQFFPTVRWPLRQRRHG
jgi:hypothetical protein